ncbi:S-adenosyl-L-methionine-dependent methyltransferases superfamily protein, partial [Prunus dulcis]
LSFADLAGSERNKKSCSSGSELKEAQSINKSLQHLEMFASRVRLIANDPTKNVASKGEDQEPATLTSKPNSSSSSLMSWPSSIIRPEPLFVAPNAQMDMKQSSDHYCLGTKFIDDKLLRTVNHIDGLKRVVLLTDGMDTRPYRLSWPTSTIIFNISPERVLGQRFQEAAYPFMFLWNPPTYSKVCVLKALTAIALFDRGPIQFYKDYVFLALCYGVKSSLCLVSQQCRDAIVLSLYTN